MTNGAPEITNMAIHNMFEIDDDGQFYYTMQGINTRVPVSADDYDNTVAKYEFRCKASLFLFGASVLCSTIWIFIRVARNLFSLTDLFVIALPIATFVISLAIATHSSIKPLNDRLFSHIRFNKDVDGFSEDYKKLSKFTSTPRRIIARLFGFIIGSIFFYFAMKI